VRGRDQTHVIDTISQRLAYLLELENGFLPYSNK